MPRSRAYLVLGLLVTLLVTDVASSAQATGMRGRMLRSMNRTRVHHDEHRLRLNLRLSHDAHRHSRRMAERGSIFHSGDLFTLTRRFGATSWGENVARAGTIRRVKRMWMRSPSHRANLLRSSYGRAGVGLVRARGQLWVTVMFYG